MEGPAAPAPAPAAPGAVQDDDVPLAGFDALNLSRSDLMMLRGQARRPFGVPEPLKTQMILACSRMLDGGGGGRLKLGAIRALIAMERADLMSERLERLRSAEDARRAQEDVEALRAFLDGPYAKAEGENG